MLKRDRQIKRLVEDSDSGSEEHRSASPNVYSDGHTTAVEAAVDGLGCNTSASGGAETVWYFRLLYKFLTCQGFLFISN